MTLQKSEAMPVLEAPMNRALDIINKGGIQVVAAEVIVPKHLQYEVKTGRKQDESGRWNDQYKVGITSDGYDAINRVVGVQFILPEWVHDEVGERVRNPIHRKDFIYLRLVGVWYNDLGQLQAYSEDLEVDFMVMYQQARANAIWYGPEKDPQSGKDLQHKAEMAIATDGKGEVIWNDDGTPRFKIMLPPEQEMKAYQRLLDLRVMGLRYAQTVAKTRIMKVATGIRTLPLDRAKGIKVKVFGYRDNLTPEQRVEQAQRDQAAIFGRALQAGATLSDDEMAALGTTPDIEVEEDIAAAAAAAKPVGNGLLDADELIER